MNTKIKYLLILTSTLVIGMIIGFLIQGRITSSRISRMRNYYTNQGFNREFMKIIRPSKEQRTLIIPILKKHAILNHQLMVNFHEGQEKVFVDLKNELESHLDTDQIMRLNHVFEKRYKRFHNGPSSRYRKGKR